LAFSMVPDCRQTLQVTPDLAAGISCQDEIAEFGG
jgi:hypothetical protein